MPRLILAAARSAPRVLYFAARDLRRQRRRGGDHDRRLRRDLRRSPPAAARWMHAALAGRVDLLSQALDASPDPQLILAPDGRIAYANTAFHDLFPQSGEPALARLAAALADPEAIADFERLRSRAAAGARAIAALPLRDSRGAAAGWFNIAVNPIAGRPGYSFWNIQDITARHEMEAVIRDERNKLVEFLDDAPIGFYSVDGAGRFLFVNQTLAKWLGAHAPPRSSAATRGCTISSPSPPPPDTAPSDPFGGRADGAQRGEVALQEPRRPHDPGLDRPEHGRRGRRAAHPLGGARPDPGARMGDRAAAVARALPALLRQRPGRHRADRPVRPAGGGEPRARRAVRRAAAGPDRRAADRLRRPRRTAARSRSSWPRRPRARPLRGRSRCASRARASAAASCS